MIKHLNFNDITLMRQLNQLFARVFEMPEDYLGKPPSDAYLKTLLKRDHFIALVHLSNEEVIGGLTAYVMPKYEQERSEIHIYDLAVDENYRRQGVATGLIRQLKSLEDHYSAWITFVQADDEDWPPINLYRKLGTEEIIRHYDLNKL